MPTHKRLRYIAISCLVALLAGTAGAQIPPARISPKIVGQERPGVVQDWENRLQIALDHLKRSDFKKGRDVADAVLQEMIERIEGGPGAAPSLGTTLLLRAAGEAGLGQMEKALWDWHTARAVDPSVSTDRLSTFGPGGERLVAAITSPTQKETLLAKKAEAAKTSEVAASGKSRQKGVSRPEKIAGDPPRYPGAVRTACIEGTLMMDAVIDEQGIPSEPGLLQSPGGPVLTVAVFEALRTWRFKPARFEGKPVPVYYALTVNYDVKTCRNAAAVALKNKKKGG